MIQLHITTLHLFHKKNNDIKTPFQVEISFQSIDEANTTMAFTVSLKGVLEDEESLSVAFQTASGSATDGVDYGTTQKTITFTNDSLTQTIEVPIYDDPYKESDENFYLTPVSSWGYNGDKTIEFVNAGEGTIIDNDNNGQVVIEVGSSSADEGDVSGSATVNVTLSSALKNALDVIMSTGEVLHFSAGETSTTATVNWGTEIADTQVDTDAPISVSASSFIYPSVGSIAIDGDTPDIVTEHSGKVSIIDDDNNNHKQPYDPGKGGMNDPLVLDTDKNGFISTIDLKDSNTYFDITGDGIKERVGWIESNDGILVYDKNNNGNIDGVDEVFGNATTSGFSELKLIADSNNDNVINANDELFTKLKIWQDENQDGISQASELKTLDELGITSINLNSTNTNIDSNGNTVVQTSTFTQNGQDHLALNTYDISDTDSLHVELTNYINYDSNSLDIVQIEREVA